MCGVFPCWGQAPMLDITGYADCTNRLEIETKKNVGPTTAPMSYGQVQEFANNPKHNLHFMENENHSVWYQFVAKTSGTLSFEIEPLDSLDDYDFALYKYTGNNFCRSVQHQSLLPVRTNFSRNKTAIGGKTGLHKAATETYVSEGVQAAYSSVLPVEKGDTLVLLVNNVYNNGAGHYLHFGYVSNRRLSTEPLPVKQKAKARKIDDSILIRWGGMVKDAGDNRNLGEATVVLKDTETDVIVAEGKSDSATGRYYFVFFTREDAMQKPLYLEARREGYWFYNQYLNPYEVTNALEHKPMRISLKKLEKGMQFNEYSILFSKHIAVPLTRSHPSIEALVYVMNANKDLKIKLTGHANGCASEGTLPEARVFTGEINAAALSLKRAQYIQNFLVQHGIDANRIEVAGRGCAALLYGITDKQAHLNTRIEIEVLDN